MKLLKSNLAKDELKDYGLYNDTKKLYNDLTEQVKNALPAFSTTNEYYKSL